jgi:hypothetical protein
MAALLRCTLNTPRAEQGSESRALEPTYSMIMGGGGGKQYLVQGLEMALMPACEEGSGGSPGVSVYLHAERQLAPRGERLSVRMMTGLSPRQEHLSIRRRSSRTRRCRRCWRRSPPSVYPAAPVAAAQRLGATWQRRLRAARRRCFVCATSRVGLVAGC